MNSSRFKIKPTNKEMGQQVQAYIETLTKPPGSLGRLEEIAVELAEITSSAFPTVTPLGVLVFAGDHGVTDEGISAFPKEVTAQMVYNFLQGGAAINVFSRQHNAKFGIIDIGVSEPIEHPNLIQKKVRNGTRNFLKEDALTKDEVLLAIDIGFEEAKKGIASGIKCLVVGEMGIGNTTVSTAILAALANTPLEPIVGIGTGISEETKAHKQEVIQKALDLRKPDPKDPVDVLMKVGGLEIAGMTGAILAAAEEGIPILLDGFICTIAAILADRLVPGCRDYMFAGHLSEEPGHAFALNLLGKQPLLQLNLRLGEASGATIAFPILQSATLMLKEMATFDSAGVSGKS